MKVAFAVIYNLLEGDLKNDERLEKIEAAVRGILNYCWRCNLTAENIAYSFPFDPSVTTAAVPIICDITLLPTHYLRQRDGRAQEIVESVQGALKALFEGEREDILVIVKDTMRLTVDFFPKE